MAKWGVWCKPRAHRHVGRPTWLKVGYGWRLEFGSRREALAACRARRELFAGVYMGSAWTYSPKRVRSLKQCA